MKESANRASKLEEILEVEAEIKKIKGDLTYKKIVWNLKQLKRRSFGNPVMTVPSPDDLDKSVEVRRHTEEMREVIRRYNERQLEYRERIRELHKRRRDLEEQLFHSRAIP